MPADNPSQWCALVLVLALPISGFAQAPPRPEEPAECTRSISVKVGNGTLQSICESDPRSSSLRHKIVISRLHPSGSGVETLAEFPFERECEWSANWAQLTCSPMGWSPLAGATYGKASLQACKSFYVCQAGCGGERTPKQITIIDLTCQDGPRS